MTYKILFNDVVAMTGGQAPTGTHSVPEIVRGLRAEGVGRMIITTDDPSRYRGDEVPKDVAVWDRGRILDAQESTQRAVHSQHNMAVVIAALAATQVSSGHVKDVAMPLTITNVMLAGPVQTMLAPGCTVCLDRIDAAGVAAAVFAHRVERLHLPAATIMDLVVRDDIEPEMLKSLTDLNVGGSACPEALRDRYRSKFGVSIPGGHGLTEVPVARENPHVTHVAGSAGFVPPQLEVRSETRATPPSSQARSVRSAFAPRPEAQGPTCTGADARLLAAP